MHNIISSSLSDHITRKDYFLVDTFRSYLNNLSFWPLFFSCLMVCSQLCLEPQKSCLMKPNEGPASAAC